MVASQPPIPFDQPCLVALNFLYIVPTSSLSRADEDVLGGQSRCDTPSKWNCLPLYLDGYVALPLIRGLMDVGMSLGTAFAFLLAGNMPSVRAVIAVFTLGRLPVFLWYLTLATIISALAGYRFEWFAGA